MNQNKPSKIDYKRGVFRLIAVDICIFVVYLLFATADGVPGTRGERILLYGRYFSVCAFGIIVLLVVWKLMRLSKKRG